MFHFSGKFSNTGNPLYANFHLREDECVTKVEDETPVNAKKPSPSEVSWDFNDEETPQSLPRGARTILKDYSDKEAVQSREQGLVSTG